MVENINDFTYLGRIGNKRGGAEIDIRARIQLTGHVFMSLGKVWTSGSLHEKTKIFNSNVQSFPLYGSQT